MSRSGVEQAASMGQEARRAVRLVLAVYRAHPTGGNLHVVLDDYNLGDVFLRSALQADALTPTERACAEALLALAEAERGAVVAAAEVEMEGAGGGY